MAQGSPREPMIRIIVADDHPIVRDGLVSILSTQADFQVAGQASNGLELLELANRLHPDVTLVDLEMPEMDGVEAIRKLQELHPEIQSIVFTAYDTDERLLAAVRAGARGYLLKGAPREQIFDAVRTAYRGESLLQPVIASKLLRHMAAPVTPTPDLTSRERQVLALLALGRTNKEIAASLVVTERTVKFHVSSIMLKLGAGNRTEAVTLAAQAGLIDL